MKALESWAQANLSERDRETLYASIPLLIAMVVGADGQFDALEMEASVDALLATTEVLGESFRWSPPAQASFDKLTERARRNDRLAYHSELLMLAEVIDQLPEDLARDYRKFVAAMVFHLAEASGGFLWFGHPISEEERIALARIEQTLGLSLGEDNRAILRGL